MDDLPPPSDLVIDEELVVPEPEPWRPPDRVRLRPLDLAVLALILLGTGIVYIARLSQPGPLLPASDPECKKYPPLASAHCHRMIPLDEVHYIPDARDVVRYGSESDTRITGDDGAYVVHPPVAKWFIALGIRAFGDRPFGWRFFGAVFGVFGVLFMYLVALHLWRTPWWAAMTAGLLALDGLWFVQSRIAMLDIYVAVFFLAAVWLLLKDRDRAIGGSRIWLMAGGVALGFALASKLSIVWMFFFAIGLAVTWDVARGGGSFLKRLALWIGALVLLPAVVYVSTFTPWFADSHRYTPPRCQDKHNVFSSWICYQREVLSFHRNLAKYEKGKPAHPYFGDGYAWPWIGRPVAHYYTAPHAGTPQERRIEVVGIPNPLIWWPGFFIAFPLLVWWTFRRRDSVAAVILALFVAGFAPNALFDIVRRPVFMFYATPLVPFVVLAVVHVWHQVVERAPSARSFAWGYVLAAVLVFAYFYPVLAGWPLSPGGFFGWNARMWLQLDCIGDKIKHFCWI